MKEGNLYEGTEKELKSAVLAFIVDDSQKGRTLEEICTKLTLKEEEAKNILSELGFSRLIRSSVISSSERWFFLKDGKEKESDSEWDGGCSRFICPVCRNQLHETNLPDKESIIKDNLYHEGGVLIVSSHVLLRCDFEHQFEKKDVTVDEPHELVAFVEAVFDQSGDCTRFVLVKIHAAENVKSMQDPGIDRRVK